MINVVGVSTLQFGLALLLVTLVYVAYRITRSFNRITDREVILWHSDLANALVRPGLNVDNLPQVRVDYGKYRPTENIPSAGNSDGSSGNSTNDVTNTTGNISASNNEEINESIAARRVRCLQRGFYLGAKNSYVDCSQFCRVASENEVRYVYLTDTSRILAGRMKITPGAWCMPTTATNCNVHSSTLVYSINGWLCLPRTDALVGEGGNRIAVCDGSIWDNATLTRYDEFVPSTLAFVDFFEDRLPDGRYRFQCLPDLRDEFRNRYILSPFNRFHLLHNYCVADIPFASDKVLPDFETGRCQCIQPYATDPSTGRCSSCEIGFDTFNLTFNLRLQPCFSLNDYVQFVTSLRNNKRNREIIRPCGIDSTDTMSSDLSRPRCIINRVSAFAPYMPSAATLRNIRDKISSNNLLPIESADKNDSSSATSSSSSSLSH